MEDMEIMNPEPARFAVGDRSFEVGPLPLRRAGRLASRILAVLQKVAKERPDLDLSQDKLMVNLADLVTLAQEDVYDALAYDVLGLDAAGREWMLDNCPAGMALKMVEAAVEKNGDLFANFRSLVERVKPGK